VNQVGLLVFLHCIELVWIDMHVVTKCVQYYCAYSTMNAVTQLQSKDNTQEIVALSIIDTHTMVNLYHVMQYEVKECKRNVYTAAPIPSIATCA